MKHVMERDETGRFVQEWMQREPVAVARYGDGEYLVMTKEPGEYAFGRESTVIADELREALSMPGQLICINKLKPHNIDDLWFHVYDYLSKTSTYDLFGSSVWQAYDFQHGSQVISRFFQDRPLFVGGLAGAVQKVFGAEGVVVDTAETPKMSASRDYVMLVPQIMEIIEQGQYKNVIFACGMIGKIVIARMANRGINLFDVGSVINAILNPYVDDDLISQWTMSWAHDRELVRGWAAQFFEQVKGIQ